MVRTSDKTTSFLHSCDNNICDLIALDDLPPLSLTHASIYLYIIIYVYGFLKRPNVPRNP